MDTVFQVDVGVNLYTNNYQQLPIRLYSSQKDESLAQMRCTREIPIKCSRLVYGCIQR